MQIISKLVRKELLKNKGRELNKFSPITAGSGMIPKEIMAPDIQTIFSLFFFKGIETTPSFQCGSLRPISQTRHSNGFQIPFLNIYYAS